MAARNALAKIAAVLPDDLRDTVDASGLLIGPTEAIVTASVDLTVVRQAIQSETPVRITYADARGASSNRTIWPIALAFFERVRVLAAWCEERQAFRHFRIDRIAHWDALGARYPRRRWVLEHVPKKLLDFFDQDMLHLFDFELRPFRSRDST